MGQVPGRVRLQIRVDSQLREELRELIVRLRTLAHSPHPPFHHWGSIRESLITEAALRFIVQAIRNTSQPPSPQELEGQSAATVCEFLEKWAEAGLAASISPYLTLRGSLAVVGSVGIKERDSPPWRHTADIYRLYVAEALLRRTTRKRARKAYEELLKHYPTPSDLASASPTDVREVLRGTGLTKRAKKLIEGAAHLKESEKSFRSIAAREGLESLRRQLKRVPLVGDYTADALALHSFGLVTLPLDSNALRVLWRTIKGTEPPQGLRDPYRNIETKLMRKKLLVHSPLRTAQLVHFAVLDIGWNHCRPKQPRCNTCPIALSCQFAHIRLYSK